MLGLSFSFKLDWDFFTIFIAKITSRKIESLILSVKYFSSEVALYLYKSTIQPSKQCSYMG